jgi:hypothetical protein
LPAGDYKVDITKLTSLQALILPADEDSREQIATHEEQQASIVNALPSVGVEDGQEDQGDHANKCEEMRQPREDLLKSCRMW